MNSAAEVPATVAEMKALIAAQRSEIEHLKLVIAKYRRAQFGRRSEQLGDAAGQLELLAEELAATASEAAAQAKAERPARTPSRRKPLPDHLPRETHTHVPEQATCPDCGGALHRIGEDVSEVLEYVPARFKVVRHVRPKFACCGCDGIVQHPAPSRPIARSPAGAGLLAHVLVAKYCDHLPLYRQSVIYAREGVDLERSTLADWVGQASHLLRPLVAALRRHVLGGAKLHADDTPVPVLDPGRGRTRIGRLWAYVRDDRPSGSTTPPAVWFAYSPDRKGEHAAVHLKDYRGALQADGYAGYDQLYDGGRIEEVACWAHVRRKFYDLHAAQASPLAAEALARIGQIYAIEAAIRGQPPERRSAARRQRAGPLLHDFHAWLHATLAQVAQKSALAGAIRYALGRWHALVRYVDDGALEIDNNAAERALRAIALGRKNYLFAGSDAGGERAAALYSLVGSAKLNGLDPEAYLRDVIACIADHPVNRVDELLPWRLAAEPAALREAA